MAGLAANRGACSMNARESVVGACQGSTADNRTPEPLPTLEDILRAPDAPGITFGGWTLRWERDVWTVGRWVRGRNRVRWKDATWYGRLDQAFQKLLDRNAQGPVSELEEAVDRVERAYLGIIDAVRRMAA